MEAYLNEYANYSQMNGINYNTAQSLYPSSSYSFSNYSEYNAYPTISYSNNVNFNNINAINTFPPVETSFNTFEASNNSNINNDNYGISNIKVLPPIYIHNNVTYPATNINYNISELNNNNYINNSYQPTYQNINYTDNNDTNMINPIEYNNNTSHPLDAFLSNNILEMTASSSNTLDYGTTITPLTYNNNNMESNNYVYTNEFDRQNNVLFKSFEPTKNKQNQNLISDLRNSYFNKNNTPYSIFSNNQSQIHDSNNYSSFSNNVLYNNMSMQPRYGIRTVPVPNNFQNDPQIHTEIIPIEEIELIPVKRIKYIKRTTIKYPRRKISMKQPELRKSYYIPKDKVQPRYNIQVSSRLSSPIRNNGRLEPLTRSISYMPDYPHDNYAGAGIYAPRIYRINLNEKKGRRKKFY